jgi:hypothetical protein
MTQRKRFRTRDDIADVEIPADKEDNLRTLHSHTVPHQQIQYCVAATFTPSEPLTDDPHVLASKLSNDRLFKLASSYSGSSTDADDQHKAAATVRDVKNGEKLSVHVWDDEVRVSVRSEDVPFGSFRDYVIFLERVLDVTLEPVLPE